MTSFAVSSGRRVPFEDSTCFFIGSKFRCMRNTPTEHDTLTALWVQVWVQLKKEKWLPISRKRHQIGQLDFRSFRLLTEMLEVRILPGEPKSLSLINYRVWVEHSVHDRMLGEVKLGSAKVVERKALLGNRSKSTSAVIEM